MKNLNFILFILLFQNISYAFIDRDRIDRDGIIPKNKLNEILDYFESHQKDISNKRFVAFIDFSLHNSKERFSIVDLESGFVESFLVAHGKNSDVNFDGMAESFSNKNNSLQSSLGFYLTAETYEGKNGYSLRLDGISESNSNARARSIVIHGADYVRPGNKIGRSYGCPAVEQRYHSYIIDLIKDGTLILASYK